MAGRNDASTAITCCFDDEVADLEPSFSTTARFLFSRCWPTRIGMY